MKNNNIRATVFQRCNIRTENVEQYSYDDIANVMKSEQYQQACIDCNAIIGNTTNNTNQLQQDFKVKNFSAFLPSIYKDNGVDTHSGVIQIDIDGMSREEQQQLRSRLIDHPNVLMMFRSIRNGLRIFALTSLADTEIDTKLHYSAYYQLLDHLEISGLQDNCGAKVKQPCFFSHDADCYYNSDCTPFEIDHDKIQEERKSFEVLTNVTYEDDLDNIELLRAFKCIDKNLGYDARREVNCAMLSILGHEAKSYLEIHWNTEKTKLKKNLQEQFANNNGAYGKRTIFKYAYQNGYKANIHGKGVKLSKRAAIEVSRISLDEFNDVLNAKFDTFFSNPSDTFLNITLGAGKTTTAITYIADHCTNTKIDILVKSHDMAEQYLDDFLKLKDQDWVKQHVIHIKGRSTDNCKDNLEREKSGFKAGDYCKKCPLANDCDYVHQFDNNDNGIRIYTHNSLYIRSSVWDKRKPDIAIIDEDVISMLLDGGLYDPVEKLGNDWLKGKTLKQAVLDNSNEILMLEADQKRHRSAEPSYAITRLTKLVRRLQKHPDDDEWIGYERIDNQLIYFAGINKINKKYANVPKLYMDGTANEYLVRKVLGNDIIYEDINVEKNPNVFVEQHTYHTFSRSMLDDWTVNQVIIYLEKFIDGYKNIGLITFQYHIDHESFLDDVATGMGANVTAYFGNVRGDNNFVDCDLLIVLGRHHSGNGCQRLYRNFHYNNFTQTDHQLEQTYVANDVWDVDGVTYENSTYKYVNDELQQFSQFMNDCETDQAIHRIRMIHSDKPKKVLIFNNVVIPALQVDRLVTNLNVYYLQNHIRDNNFVVNKNRHMADVLDISSKIIANQRSKSELIENIVADKDLASNVIPIKHNGRTASFPVIQRIGYVMTEDDINPFFKGNRGISLVNVA